MHGACAHGERVHGERVHSSGTPASQNSHALREIRGLTLRWTEPPTCQKDSHAIHQGKQRL